MVYYMFAYVMPQEKKKSFIMLYYIYVVLYYIILYDVTSYGILHYITLALHSTCMLLEYVIVRHVAGE